MFTRIKPQSQLANMHPHIDVSARGSDLVPLVHTRSEATAAQHLQLVQQLLLVWRSLEAPSPSQLPPHHCMHHALPRGTGQGWEQGSNPSPYAHT